MKKVILIRRHSKNKYIVIYQIRDISHVLIGKLWNEKRIFVFYYFKILFSNLSDEEEQQLQPLTLTRQHKGAIRAIRKVK